MLSKFKCQKDAIWQYAGILEARGQLAHAELMKGYTHKALFHLDAMDKYIKHFLALPLNFPVTETKTELPEVDSNAQPI